MHVAHLVLIALLLVTGTACIVESNVTFHRILKEVNSKRPPGEQYSFLFVTLRGVEITKEHAREFPQSPKRKWMNIWSATGFILFLLAFLSGFIT